MRGAVDTTAMEQSALKRRRRESARELARAVIGERHSRVRSEYDWDGKRHIVVWCNSADHADAAVSTGVRWPCDAVRLARAVLDDPTAGASDEP